jgi:5'-3' exonuclease
VDAPSLVYRALFSTPDTVRTPAGDPINAAYGFLGMLARLVAGQRPDELACADDADWRPEWRVRLVETYKLHRTVPGSPAVAAEERLRLQLPVLWELLALCGVPVVSHPGFEAEDVIGTLAARARGAVAIFSGDRDLFQLVRDPEVRVLYPRRGTSDLIVVDEAYITGHYGIPGRGYADFAVLRGDTSDGLPGVRGIGEKMAAALVSRYGSLEAILRASEADGAAGALSKVRRDRDYIARAEQVVRIPTDLPIPPADLRVRQGERPPELWELAERHGLSGPLNRLLEALS